MSFRALLVAGIAVIVVVAAMAVAGDAKARADRAQGRYSIVKNNVGGYSLARGGFDRAKRYFGEPVSDARDNLSCDLTWENGLTISFDYIGSCSNFVGSARIDERGCPALAGCPPNGRRWRNRLGLRLGLTVREMRRIYPKARRECRACTLIGHRDLWQLDWRFNPVLEAETKGGRVKAIAFILVGH